MDEPLSNLDAKLRVQMRAEISKAASKAEYHHDLCDARSDRSHDDGNRIVILKDGYIQQVGAPKRVYNEPANMFAGQVSLVRQQ